MATVKDNLVELKSNEDLHRKGNQIFVRNLSYETTSDDLISLFQEYGPVKRAAIVQENGTSRGFGFVKFALGEDASDAIKNLQGREFKGRKMVLEIAVNRGENPVKSTNSKVAKKTATTDVSIDEKNATTSESSDAISAPTTVILTKQKNTKPEVSSIKKLENSKLGDKSSSDIQLNHSLSVKATKKIAKAPSLPPTQSENATATTTIQEVKQQSPSGLASSNKRGLQIVLFGIPSDINKKVVKRVASKCSRKYEVTVELVNEEHPMFSLLSVTNPSGKVMLIKAKSRKQAGLILTKFNNATVHNLGLRQLKLENTSSKSNNAGGDIVKVAVVVDDKGRKEHITAKVLSNICFPLTLRKRKCRVIIRNLSFQADENNIAVRLGSFGPVQDVWLPRVAVPMSDRDKRRKQSSDETGTQSDVKMRPRGFAFVTFLCLDDAISAVKGCQGLKICNREVAIDFCESKDIFQEHQLTDGKDEGKEKEEADKENPEEEDEEEVDEDEDDDDSDEENESGEEESSDDNDEDEDDNETEKKSKRSERHKSENEKKEPKIAPDDVSEGKTIFVRDLSFDATVTDLRKSFGVFGKIEMAALVKDKDTGLNRGSAFVKFASLDSVQEALSSEFPILVQDRPCRVTVALDKTSAVKMKEDVKTASTSKDRRNLYLSVEGLKISENMSEPDRQKRKRAQLEKKKKLCNPLYFISPTRISVRGLKKSITDEQLRSLCMKAAKAGLHRHLVSPSDVDRLLLAQFAPLSERTPNKLVIPPITGGAIKSAKIMLDLKRLRDGKPQSRGYGFVEFTCHAHALSCLRELDSNPIYANEAAPGGQSLLVEFSLENVEKVKLLESREQRRQQLQKSQTPASSPSPAQIPKKARPATSTDESYNNNNHSDRNRNGSSSSKPSLSATTGNTASNSNQEIKKKRKSEMLSSSSEKAIATAAAATVPKINNTNNNKRQRSNDNNSNENHTTNQTTKSTEKNITVNSPKKNKKANNKSNKNNNKTKTTIEANSVIKSSPSVATASMETSTSLLPTPSPPTKQSMKRKSEVISSSDNNNNSGQKSIPTTSITTANKKLKQIYNTIKPTDDSSAAARANNNNNNNNNEGSNSNNNSNSKQPPSSSGKKPYQKKKDGGGGGSKNNSEGVRNEMKKGVTATTSITSQDLQQNSNIAAGSYRGFKRIRNQKKMKKA